MDEQGRVPQADRDRSIAEVIDDLGVRLRPGGPDGEIDEWSIYDESFRRLVRWADDREVFFEGLQPLKDGGREHDLTYEPESETWLKFTKPAAAGYIVDFEGAEPVIGSAMPLEYLDRLLVQNEIFADSVSFVGVGGTRAEPRIITRQPHVRGEAATLTEIRDLMTLVLGFQELPAALRLGYTDSLAFAREDAAVFDLRPANVVRTPGGLIVPIDSIAVRLDTHAREVLGMS